MLAELELWPNLIRAAHRSGVKLVVVNGRLSDKSFRGYRRIRPLVAAMLRANRPDLPCRMKSTPLDFAPWEHVRDSIAVTGSLKFDGAQTDRSNPATRRLATLAGIAPEDIVLLAGSTQEPEEALALETFRELSAAHPRLRLMLVPRHPARWDEVAALLDRSGLPWQRRTTLDQSGALTDARILLVDTVGELGGLVGYGRDRFRRRKHGPPRRTKHDRAGGVRSRRVLRPEYTEFPRYRPGTAPAGGRIVVHNGAELTAFVRKCLEDPAWAATLGHRARQLVLDQRGATDETMRRISELLQSCGLTDTGADRKSG